MAPRRTLDLSHQTRGLLPLLPHFYSCTMRKNTLHLQKHGARLTPPRLVAKNAQGAARANASAPARPLHPTPGASGAPESVSLHYRRSKAPALPPRRAGGYPSVYWTIKYLLNPLRTAHTELITGATADHSAARKILLQITLGILYISSTALNKHPLIANPHV